MKKMNNTLLFSVKEQSLETRKPQFKVHSTWSKIVQRRGNCGNAKAGNKFELQRWAKPMKGKKDTPKFLNIRLCSVVMKESVRK